MQGALFENNHRIYEEHHIRAVHPVGPLEQGDDLEIHENNPCEVLW